MTQAPKAMGRTKRGLNTKVAAMLSALGRPVQLAGTWTPA
jgi:hypothetical protein